MMKYHIKKDGTPGLCYARTKPCPLGGAENHFDTQEEAERVSQERFENEMGITSHFNEDRVNDFLEWVEDDPAEANRLMRKMTEADRIEAGARFDYSGRESEVEDLPHKWYVKRFNEDYRSQQREIIRREREAAEAGKDKIGYVREAAEADLYNGDFSELSIEDFKAADEKQKETQQKYRGFWMNKHTTVDHFLETSYPELNRTLSTNSERVNSANELYSDWFKGFTSYVESNGIDYNYSEYNFDDKVNQDYRASLLL